jgi:hypothetical protein
MRDDRGVSTTVDYVLALAITSVVVSGLLIAGGGTVADERERVTTDELEVLGGQLAAGFLDADNLASTDGAERAAVRVTLTDRAAGSSYTIQVRNPPSPTGNPYRYDLLLESDAAGVSATVTIRTHHEAVLTGVSGGTVVVRVDDADGDGESELVLESGPLTPPLSAVLPVELGGEFATTTAVI